MPGTSVVGFFTLQRLVCLCITSALSLPAQGLELTQDNGATVGDDENSQTAGPNGPVLLQDEQLIQKLQRFDRERIPERVVHSRGVGAHGRFTATATLDELTKAKLFTAGTVTPVFVRFSSMMLTARSATALHDVHGFATKFYTAEGNWDLVGSSFPTYFIRDAIKFPDMVHALKPDPRTNLDDDSRRFDFFSHVPEATRTLTELYSDAGLPASFREMNGHSVHAYKFVNDEGEMHYVKFHWRSLQGAKNLSPRAAARLHGMDNGHMSTDLVQQIKQGNFPKWDLYVQLLKPQELAGYDFDPLDATKIWPQVPMRKIGQLVLNRNPTNAFQETAQVAMSPSNLIPGIEPSEDRLLQGRTFSYADAQMYRLGANAMQLPINAARKIVSNSNQDGALNTATTTSAINYQPSRRLPREQSDRARYSSLVLLGKTQEAKIHREQNFKQAGELYRSFSNVERQHLIDSFGAALVSTDDISKHQILAFLYKADPAYGTAVTLVAKGNLLRVQSLAAELRD